MSLEEAISNCNIADTVKIMMGIAKANKMAPEALTSFLNKCQMEIGAQTREELKQKSLAASSTLGGSSEEFAALEQMQFIEPRGRFNVKLSGGGIVLDGKLACFIPWSVVEHAMILPENASSKKDGEDLLAFVCKTPVKLSSGKEQKNFLWKLSKDPKKILDLSKTVPSNLDISKVVGTDSDVVSFLFTYLLDRPLDGPKPNVFQSQQGKPKPFLRCYKGIQEGALYPLATGLLFVKPMLFLSAHDIESIVAGRGGSAQTRYIDLMIQDATGRDYEFTNIDRDELSSLQSYVQFVLKESKRRMAAEEAVQSSAAGGACASATQAVTVDDDSDDESDDDFDPDANSDSEDGGDGGDGNGDGCNGADTETDGGDSESESDSEDDDDYEPENGLPCDEDVDEHNKENGSPKRSKLKKRRGQTGDIIDVDIKSESVDIAQSSSSSSSSSSSGAVVDLAKVKTEVVDVSYGKRDFHDMSV
jgi:hypothetical protein